MVQRYLATRLVHALLVVWVVATATFGLLALSPGGPAILLNPDLTVQDRANLARSLGLDEPAYLQYARWLGKLVQLDLGRSFETRQPVAALIAERLPATALLGLASLGLAVLVAVPAGVAAAQRRGSWLDRTLMVGTLVGLSVPSFWLAIVLILVCSVMLRWLPSGGMSTPGDPFSAADLLKHLIMPAVVLALLSTAELAKYTRSSVLSVLRRDYVRTARGKGLPERAVLLDHTFRNALVPVVTVIGLLLPRLVGGAVITETIFSWPGIGRLSVMAAFQRDYPVVMGVTLLVSVMVVFSSLLVDVLYAYLDPRIRVR
jgi:peptide/nickel transport system permease protein